MHYQTGGFLLLSAIKSLCIKQPHVLICIINVLYSKVILYFASKKLKIEKWIFSTQYLSSFNHSFLIWIFIMLASFSKYVPVYNTIRAKFYCVKTLS